MLLFLLSCHGPAALSLGELSDRLYELQFGDTLAVVAEAYAVPGGWPALARLNHLANPHQVYAGSKLKVPTRDTTLPPWPKLTAAEPTTPAAVEPLVARHLSLGGCEAAACLDLGQGRSACACEQPGGGRLLLTRPGQRAWAMAVAERQPWWLDPGAVLEPSNAATFVGYRANLDGDRAPETVVAWRHHLSDLGMSDWTVMVVDDDGSTGPTFEADNFGPDGIVTGSGHADLLVANWTMGDEPAHDNDGWYLLGRRYSVEGAELRPAGQGVTARRLWSSFHPGAARIGNVRVGTAGRDLATGGAFRRDTEPELDVLRLDRSTEAIRSLSADESGLLTLATSARTEALMSDGVLRRLGDKSTGTLFPRDYRPGDLEALRGRSIEIQAFRGWWYDEWMVGWL